MADKTKTSLTLHFIFYAETKGAFRYEEVADETATEPLRAAGQPYIVGSLYLRKETFADGKAPEHLVVAIVASDG